MEHLKSTTLYEIIKLAKYGKILILGILLSSSFAWSADRDIKEIFAQSASLNTTKKITSYWQCGSSKGDFNFVLYNSSSVAGYLFLFDKEKQKSYTKLRVSKWHVVALGSGGGSIFMSTSNTSDTIIEVGRLVTSTGKLPSFAGAAKIPDQGRRGILCQEIRNR